LQTKIFFLFVSVFTCFSNARAENLEMTPLIFVPGIKGSVLVNPQNKIQWVTFWQALNLSGGLSTLGLPIQWNGDSQEKDSLHPEGILSEVGFSFLGGEKVYAPFLKNMHPFGARFFPFAYDWRRDNNESAELLELFIKKILIQTHSKKVQAVAHSMGGLLLYSVMLKHPEWFQNVTFAGVPFSGGIGFLPDLHQGLATGLNSEILSPEVLETFPSVFTLFQSAKYFDIVDENGKGIDINFYKPEDWRNHHLGPFAGSRNPGEKFFAFFKTTLKRALVFRKSLEVSEIQALEMNKIDITVVLSEKFPTLLNVIKNGPENSLGYDFKTAEKVPGDGRVPASRAKLPSTIKYQVYQSNFSHAHLLDDNNLLEVFIKQ
jgi:hypothetical protein